MKNNKNKTNLFSNQSIDIYSTTNQTVSAATAEVEPVADIATETEARPSIAVDPLYLLFSFCDITCTTILWFTAQLKFLHDR